MMVSMERLDTEITTKYNKFQKFELRGGGDSLQPLRVNLFTCTN